LFVSPQNHKASVLDDWRSGIRATGVCMCFRKIISAKSQGLLAFSQNYKATKS